MIKLGIPLQTRLTICKWSLRGYSLHGHVFLVYNKSCDVVLVGVYKAISPLRIMYRNQLILNPPLEN